ncbi:hypothetical protein [Pseudosulfitobacter sp. DSM 107133]|uniref:hypothetical protein n=1 Tax=Pseudosulfitobacter sp. DSM 107133 TaxID=2883100 RepID=UPI0013B3BFCD|nr:hypothetical protein [Pseudosulfitobacter sp. DSM 107133]
MTSAKAQSHRIIFGHQHFDEMPELTEDERRLGELPGFTPERIEQWLETYPGEIIRPLE